LITGCVNQCPIQHFKSIQYIYKANHEQKVLEKRTSYFFGGMWWCSGFERQRFGKKAMRLLFRNPAEPVKNL
jgi:hypothetical protein